MRLGVSQAVHDQADGAGTDVVVAGEAGAARSARVAHPNGGDLLTGELAVGRTWRNRGTVENVFPVLAADDLASGLRRDPEGGAQLVDRLAGRETLAHLHDLVGRHLRVVDQAPDDGSDLGTRPAGGLPALHQKNPPHGQNSDPVAPREPVHRFATRSVGLAHLDHLSVGQLREPVALTRMCWERFTGQRDSWGVTATRVSVPGHFLVHVLFVRSEMEMGGVQAKTVVTRMENVEPRRDGAVGQLVGDPVSALRPMCWPSGRHDAHVYQAVLLASAVVRSGATRPVPTGFCLLHLRPKQRFVHVAVEEIVFHA